MKKISKVIANKMSMFKVVLLLCEQNLAILALFTEINNIYILFRQLITDLDSLVTQKLIMTTGLSQGKKELKKQLVDMALCVAGSIHAYASKVKDTNLQHESDYNFTRLSRMRDNEFTDTCTSIYNLAMANATNIAGYGADATLLQTYQAAVSLYDTTSPAPLNAIEHNAMLNTSIAAKEKEIRDFLNEQFDRVIPLLKQSNPEFVDEYFKSRKIFDFGIRHKKTTEEPEAMAYMTGKITDTDGNILEDVTVDLISDTVSYSDTTDEDGDFLHEAINSGKYTMTVSGAGFKTQKTEIEFAANDEILKDIVLEKDELADPVKE